MNERAVGRSWAAHWGLAMVFAMISLVSAACLGSLWYAEAEGYRLISQQERQLTASEVDLMATLYAEEGRESVVRAITRRIRAALGKHDVYALRSPEGEIIAGNLRLWPETVDESQEWGKTIELANGRSVHIAIRRLPDGATLLVGRDDAQIEEFRDDLLDAVWIAVAVVAITCLLLATAIIAYILSRVRRLSSVAARVAAGDFTARAGDVIEGGPFGEIASAQNAMLDRIEHLVTGLTTVTDSLAHDLRTPLSRMRRVLEEGLAAEGPAQRAALESALGEANNIISTFTSLIDIARAEGGLSRNAMEEVDLSVLAREVYDLLEPLAQEKGLTLELDLPASAQMHGHRPLLMQAASNLVHNAIKFSPPGGRVTISIAEVGDQLALAVGDNGPGIEPSDREAVRQRFKRIRREDPEGLGLGLAIVDACARLHRGRLALEDNHPGLMARLELARR